MLLRGDLTFVALAIESRRGLRDSVHNQWNNSWVRSKKGPSLAVKKKIPGRNSVTTRRLASSARRSVSQTERAVLARLLQLFSLRVTSLSASQHASKSVLFLLSRYPRGSRSVSIWYYSMSPHFGLTEFSFIYSFPLPPCLFPFRHLTSSFPDNRCLPRARSVFDFFPLP